MPEGFVPEGFVPEGFVPEGFVPEGLVLGGCLEIHVHLPEQDAQKQRVPGFSGRFQGCLGLPQHLGLPGKDPQQKLSASCLAAVHAADQWQLWVADLQLQKQRATQPAAAAEAAAA